MRKKRVDKKERRKGERRWGCERRREREKWEMVLKIQGHSERERKREKEKWLDEGMVISLIGVQCP